MDKIENVNLNEALRDIAKCNTFFHLDNDLNISIDQMKRAAKMDDPAEKTLIWVSTPTGIDCYTEREVFQRESRGYNGMMFHGFDMPRDLKLAYAVDVSSENGGAVFGSLQQIDLRQYAEHMRETAVNSGIIKLYLNDPDDSRKTMLMSKGDFFSSHVRDLPKMEYFRYEPHDPAALQKLLDGARQNRDADAKPRDLWGHESELYDKRTAFYSNQIVESLYKLREPNSADRQFFHAPLNSYVAAALEPHQLSKILDALPYDRAEFSLKKGELDMKVIVPRDDVLQLRGEPEDRPKKPSLLDMLDKTDKAIKQQGKIPAVVDGIETPKKPNREAI